MGIIAEPTSVPVFIIKWVNARTHVAHSKQTNCHYFRHWRNSNDLECFRNAEMKHRPCLHTGELWNAGLGTWRAHSRRCLVLELFTEPVLSSHHLGNAQYSGTDSSLCASFLINLCMCISHLHSHHYVCLTPFYYLYHFVSAHLNVWFYFWSLFKLGSMMAWLGNWTLWSHVSWDPSTLTATRTGDWTGLQRTAFVAPSRCFIAFSQSSSIHALADESSLSCSFCLGKGANIYKTLFCM